MSYGDVISSDLPPSLLPLNITSYLALHACYTSELFTHACTKVYRRGDWVYSWPDYYIVANSTTSYAALLKVWGICPSAHIYMLYVVKRESLSFVASTSYACLESAWYNQLQHYTERGWGYEWHGIQTVWMFPSVCKWELLDCVQMHMLDHKAY